MSFNCILGITCFAFTLFSCTPKSSDNLVIEDKKDTNLKFIYKDDFENELQDFWFMEAVDSTRFEIVQDPLDENNKVLQVNLQLDDYANGGSRAEIKLTENEPLDVLSKYSFRFLLPESFFQTDEKPGMIIIHQWHDQADPGFNWVTQKKSTHPPVHLFVDRKEGGKYQLVFKTGLETGDMNETVASVWSEDLVANKWYTFSCEVLWHIYTDTGYALPMLDGKPFYNNSQDLKNPHRIYRRNMYNGIGNYFKIGLYKFGNEKHPRTIYFDDFILESEKVDCAQAL